MTNSAWAFTAFYLGKRVASLSKGDIAMVTFYVSLKYDVLASVKIFLFMAQRCFLQAV